TKRRPCRSKRHRAEETKKTCGQRCPVSDVKTLPGVYRLRDGAEFRRNLREVREMRERARARLKHFSKCIGQKKKTESRQRDPSIGRITLPLVTTHSRRARSVPCRRARR